MSKAIRVLSPDQFSSPIRVPGSRTPPRKSAQRQPPTFESQGMPLGSTILSQGRCENRLTESTGCARGNGGPDDTIARENKRGCGSTRIRAGKTEEDFLCPYP